MRYFLTSVKIEGFRGINNESDPLELAFKSDSVNSIFSTNAVGKSSIFDALCYAIRGFVPKLESLQAQERPEDYVCNLFHSQGLATIDLQFKPDDGTSPLISVRVERDSSGQRTVTSPSGYSDPEQLLHSLNEDFALLDYRTFENFIENTPLERGRSFAALLGLSRYSSFTQALRSVADTRALNTDLNLTELRTQLSETAVSSQGALRRLASAYEKLTGKQISDVSDLDSYVTEVVTALTGIELIKDEITGKDLDKIDFEKINEKIRTEEGGEKRKELEDTLKRAENLKSLGSPDEKTTAEQDQLKAMIDEKAKLLAQTKGEQFKNLYDAADAILKSGEWQQHNKCPLCESDLEVPIAGMVSSKRDQYDKVKNQLEEIRTKWATSKWVARLANLEKSEDVGIADNEVISAALSTKANNGQLDDSDFDKAISALEEAEKKLSEALGSAEARKDELEKELPPSLVTLAEQIQAATQFQEAAKDYRQTITRYKGIQAKIAVREQWQKFINDAEKAFADAEAELAQKKIAEIDSDYKVMFAKIMVVDDVVPELYRPDHRQDLHVHLKEFHGLSDLSAKALLSESFRNALAISVFLSAALKHTGAPRFVVLDDVTSSFDSGYQWNVMEAIRLNLQQPKNVDGLQFIILSHDGLLEKYFDKLGNTKDWHHQKLHGMPPLGAVITQVQDADRLKQTTLRFLNSGQVGEAGPLLRQYLEFKLLQVINKVSIPVPLDFAIKDHQKIVSNCLRAIKAAIDLHKKAGSLILDNAQISDMDTIHVPVLVGNWVAHYETASGSSLAPAVLKGIIQTIDDFSECFRYEDTSGGTTQRKWYKSLSSK